MSEINEENNNLNNKQTIEYNTKIADIIKLSEEYLDNFYTIYNIFNNYVISKRKNLNNKLFSKINVNIHNTKNEQNENSINKSENEQPLFLKTYEISLDLYHGNKPIIDGIKLTISHQNYPIFKYLIFNLLIFYIQKNYKKEISSWQWGLNNDYDDWLRNLLNTTIFDSFDLSVGSYSSYFDFHDIISQDKKMTQTIEKIIIRTNNDIYNIDDLLFPIKEEFEKCNIDELDLETIKEHSDKKEKILNQVFSLKKK